MASFEDKVADAVVKALSSGRYASTRYHTQQTGRVFWVMLTTKTNYGAFVKDHPSYKSGDGVTTVAAVYNTITLAIAACTASQGDVIYVDQGYTETVTAAITCDKIGISIIGLGHGTLRPTITGNFAGDAVTITAANTRIENIRFAGPLTTAQTADINVAAAGVVIRNTFHLGSVATEYKVDMITVASGGNDLLVESVRAFNTVVTTNTSWLSLEAAVARCEIRNCYIAGEFATAVLMDEATSTLNYIHHNTFKNVTAAVACVTFATGNSTGVMEHCFVSGRHTTIASNLVEGTGMDFHQVYVVEEAAKNGLLEPVVDAE